MVQTLRICWIICLNRQVTAITLGCNETVPMSVTDRWHVSFRSTDHLIDNFGEFQSLSVLTDASDQQFIELAPDVQFSVNMQCEPVIDELNNSLMEYLTKDCLETCQVGHFSFLCVQILLIYGPFFSPI